MSNPSRNKILRACALVLAASAAFPLSAAEPETRIAAMQAPRAAAPLGQAVERVGRALAAQTGIAFRFVTVDSSISDAWGASDGEVVVTLGALGSLQDEHELAALLAWEMARVRAQQAGGRVRVSDAQVARDSAALLRGAGYRAEGIPALVRRVRSGAPTVGSV